jgi:hypothetical protein
MLNKTSGVDPKLIKKAYAAAEEIKKKKAKQTKKSLCLNLKIKNHEKSKITT